MRKEHSLSVLLIAVFWEIFVPSIEVGPWGTVGSAVAAFTGQLRSAQGVRVLQ